VSTSTHPPEARPAFAAPAGYIYNVMRYALHDGPGIRTTVFFKGCPLRCWWCHNPESLDPRPQLVHFADRCLQCGDCIPICPNGAVRWVNHAVSMDGACKSCGTCADFCAAGARELVGKWMTVAEAMAEIERDLVFFDESGGGVTFSGGEPLLQPEFLEALLDACRARGIHTVVDTSGLAPRDVVVRLAGKADLFYFDVKLVDSTKHRRFTGAPNEIILANLKTLVYLGANVVVRVPVIPGVNDSAAEVAELAALLSQLGIERAHLLPYHHVAAEKYRRLNLPDRMNGVAPPSAERLAEIAAQLEAHGIKTRIGGA
jgi:pyruvate formate lyase activating enzyme